jgi:predicted nuclease of predicted toxin-antitoxin system
MKVKIDENLPREVADLLREAGHDAITVGAEGLSGRSDGTIAARIRREGRGLLALDTGFSDIRAYPPEQHAGLVVLRLNRQDKPHVLQVIARLILVLAGEEPKGRLWIVEEDRVRIRP